MTSRDYIPYSISVEGTARPLAAGPMFPSEATVHFIEAATDLFVAVTLRTVDRRPVLSRLEVRPVNPNTNRELTAGFIHELPLGQLVDRAVRAVGASFADEQAGVGMGDPKRQGDAAVASRRRRVMNDDLLREVAEVVASDTYGRPREAVREHFHVSLRTASRWIAEAKQRGPFDDQNQTKPAIEQGGN